ncbi:MAG: NVEALA domain-containing protein [Bacteroidaceae bacterium]|nr:NVEALA domain-containing protein [Bacteroidaceae bacterium]
MRKKILSATFVVAVMAVAGYNMYMSQSEFEMSELAMANVEALAYPEGETILTCGTKYENINEKEPCEMDHLYSFGRFGTEYSETTGTHSKYKKGFMGFIYVCTSSVGIESNEVKEYNCGKDEFSNIFDFLN